VPPATARSNPEKMPIPRTFSALIALESMLGSRQIQQDGHLAADSPERVPTMLQKWLQVIKRFIELFTPGGTEYTKNGKMIIFSRTGDMTTPSSEYKRILLKQVKELNEVAPLPGREPKRGSAH
jgi:hypothetical protein